MTTDQVGHWRAIDKPKFCNDEGQSLAGQQAGRNVD